MSVKIRVAVRMRPLIEREHTECAKLLWKIKAPNIIYQVDENDKQTLDGINYHFDRVFTMMETNRDVFGELCKPIVDSVLKGFHGTIFAYGQTSSGKTFTMMGSQIENGVTQLSIAHIFNTIEESHGRDFLLRVSYMEIYNERISDLLAEDTNAILKIKENVSGHIFVEGLKEVVVRSPEEVFKLMEQGSNCRRIAETNMNERSSRSHTIFRMVVESRLGNGHCTVAHLNFVDLAGSEKTGQMGTTGERFKEGVHINKSLLNLADVICKLSEGKFVNYRDSKLTRILKNSLGGNAMTAIICNITAATIEQTNSTLKFAARAKTIRNKPVINEIGNDDQDGLALLKKYQCKILDLESKISLMESNKKSQRKEMEDLRFQAKVLKSQVLAPGGKQISKEAKRRETWGGKLLSQNLNNSIKALQTESPIADEVFSPVDQFPGFMKPENFVTMRKRTRKGINSLRSFKDDFEALDSSYDWGTSVNSLLIEQLRFKLDKKVTELSELQGKYNELEFRLTKSEPELTDMLSFKLSNEVVFCEKERSREIFHLTDEKSCGMTLSVEDKMCGTSFTAVDKLCFTSFTGQDKMCGTSFCCQEKSTITDTFSGSVLSEVESNSKASQTDSEAAMNECFNRSSQTLNALSDVSCQTSFFNPCASDTILQTSLCMSDISELEDNKKTSQQQFASLSEEFEVLSKNLSQTTSELLKTREALLSLESQLEEKENEGLSLKTEVKRLKEEVEELEDCYEHYRCRYEQANDDVTQLSTDLRTVQITLNDVQREKESLESTITQNISLINSKDSTVITKELEKTKEERDNLDQEYNDFLEIYNNLKLDHQSLLDELDLIKRELKQYQDNSIVMELKEGLKTMQENPSTVSKQLMSKNENYKMLEIEHAKLKKSCESSEFNLTSPKCLLQQKDPTILDCSSCSETKEKLKEMHKTLSEEQIKSIDMKQYCSALERQSESFKIEKSSYEGKIRALKLELRKFHSPMNDTIQQFKKKSPTPSDATDVSTGKLIIMEMEAKKEIRQLKQENLTLKEELRRVSCKSSTDKEIIIEETVKTPPKDSVVAKSATTLKSNTPKEIPHSVLKENRFVETPPAKVSPVLTDPDIFDLSKFCRVVPKKNDFYKNSKQETEEPTEVLTKDDQCTQQ